MLSCSPKPERDGATNTKVDSKILKQLLCVIFQLLQHTKRAYNICYHSYSCSLPLIPSAITGVTRVTGYSSSSITARCFFIAYMRYSFSGLTL